ncbi:RagB/SusD family nutrient uptake outer membrane protein [Pseudoflavitalea sp. G-6-1-2]|uniref:RagB/SusD family nutrient uptake outer membrane protein n=1 Tax=Pseudoflavitalea sp. G-6-1-2 TaxID=2728841 RepID=UPI00146CAC83|nr:RagB/SusD family nutrient uptake outer membrane protein [Pseudoflavitalea sp. G-6-1-2]NML21679.1 RagB/SusD family nutrient uptake outer membrane protein [Pseudoflavitalea sp. G-6-1-2]
MRTSYSNNSITKASGTILSACLLLLIIAGGASCKKFLSTYSQNETFLKTTEDLQEVLVGEGYYGSAGFAVAPVFMDIIDDDAEDNKEARPSLERVYLYQNLYQWQALPFTNSVGEPITETYYLSQYRRMMALNTILENIPAVQQNGGSAEELKRISGEAHFLRGLINFNLANVYGLPYKTSTAGSDWSIPLKISAAVEDKQFTRNTVQQVYDQILKDLLESEKELAGKKQLTVKASQAAAQALLSRVCLFMEKYDEAISWADKAMAQKDYAMTDLNTLPNTASVNSRTSTETFFCFPNIGFQTAITETFAPSNFVHQSDNFRASGDLMSLYSSTDLRKSRYFTLALSSEWIPSKMQPEVSVLDKSVIRYSELLLNKAEAQAILGRNNEAAETIQELRKHRFKPADLTVVTATGAALVNFIRDERRRELSFEMHRWFDLRRYAVNNAYPFSKTIRHIAYSYSGGVRYIQGYFELNPYEQDKAAYVIPIPLQEVEFSQGGLVNPTRPVRPMKN